METEIKKSFLTDEHKVKQLYYATLTLLFILVVSLIYSFVQLDRASRDMSKVADNRVQSINLANELRQSSDNLTRMARSYVTSGNDVYFKQYYKVLDIRNGLLPRPVDYHRSYWQLIDITDPNAKAPRENGEAIPITELMRNAGFTDDEFEKLETAERLSNKLAELEIKSFKLIKSLNATNESIHDDIRIQAIDILFNAEYAAQKTLIMEQINSFEKLTEARLENSKNIALHVFENAESLFYTLILMAIIVLFVTFLLTQQTNKIQLERTVKEQEEAEEENEKINNSIINILQSVSLLSQKDLTARAPVTDDVVGTVSDSINFLADETGRVMQEVKDVAEKVKDSSTKVQSQAQQVTQTAEAERLNVESMIESLFEATETMNQVAALAEDTNNAGSEATKVTESALETVNGTVVGMESIRTTIAETEKRIKRLGERSQEISGIVSLINTISERTHVLALNASMQAAVAGEAGRGFAVVAEEVQRLAESSQNATQQIESLVNNIQIETNETINTVNNTISQVVEGSTKAQQAGKQMRETQEITAKLVEQVKFIADASEKQKSMSVQLLDSVKLMGESTEQTASQIMLQNVETENLQLASDSLVETVSVFKLPKR